VVDDGASVPGGARRGDYLPGNDGRRRISHFPENNRAADRHKLPDSRRLMRCRCMNTELTFSFSL
jgi:hypothetical protein